MVRPLPSPHNRGLTVLFLGIALGAFAGACEGVSWNTGRHREVVASECVTCHQAEFRATKHPAHAGVFPETCGTCHSEDSWVPATFTHSWPLEGPHADASCTSCHVGDPPVYQGTPKECVGCHRDDYDASPFPGHSAFPTTCESCHTITGWKPATFNHSWPLAGGHTGVACTSCHVGDPPVYQGTPKECVSCHREDYDANPFPGHSAFPTTCESCHTVAGWKPATVNHSWPLTGVHSSTACTSCHVGDPPVYQGTPKECVGCHQQDYDTSPFPGHGSFPTTCESCHTTSGWKPATFTHSWPLTGAHTNAPCTSCHVGDPPVYQGTPKECVGCHQQDYDTSPFPGHGSFPTTCESCHTNTAWTPATGGHPEGAFPLSGAHSGIECMQCHNASLGPNGKGNADCVGCHTGEHTRASMDAKHREESGYPTGAAPPNFCLDCHADGRN